MTVEEHQKLTVERYLEIRAALNDQIYLMPVLQGWEPEDYVSHINQYGTILTKSMWVGIGSICRRQNTREVYQIVGAINSNRPDLRLHGFGVKTSALKDPLMNYWFYSADSMAWSYAARRENRDRNSIYEALQFWEKISKYDAGLFERLK